MSIDKNFIVKNGLEVNSGTLYVNSDTRLVGVGTTNPIYNLEVSGIIGLSSAISVGGTTGKPNQVLFSTGNNAQWSDLPNLRNNFIEIAADNQGTFPLNAFFPHDPNYFDVFLNGVKLRQFEEFTSINSNTRIEITVPTFEGDVVELIAYNAIASSGSVQGLQGISGSAGVQGSQGIQGISGAYAAQGIQGTQGIQGLLGIQGTTGLQGLQGTDGIQGIQGRQGIQGLQGIQGIIGIQGIQGIRGSDGILGAQGTQGTQGVQGIQGIQGIQGALGSQGIQGVQGLQGIIGPAGIQGTQGIAGIGSTGIQGLPGLQGSQGVQGISGAYAAQGIQGIQGPLGIQGSVGVPGDQGIPGTQGIQGTQGLLGVQGSQGIQGRQGIQGIQGVPGPVSGSNSQVIFNQNNVSSGATNFTYNPITQNVGIGTADATSKLSVFGNVNISGIVTATAFFGDGSGLTGIVGGGGGATVTISDSQPNSPSAGNLWYNSSIGRGFIYYNDGNSSQWVDFSPAGAGLAITDGFSGGSSYWDFNSTGINALYNVGIGTTTASSKLTVSGNTLLQDTRITGVSTFTNSVDIYGVLSFKSSNNSNVLSIDEDNGSITFFYEPTNRDLTWYLRDTSVFNIKDPASDEKVVNFKTGGSCELYYDGSKKIETNPFGIIVTGITSTSSVLANYSDFYDYSSAINGFRSGDNNSQDFNAFYARWGPERTEQFRLRTSNNSGSNVPGIELAVTYQDTSINVRQYAAGFASKINELTLLDTNGNTIVNNNLGIGTTNATSKLSVLGNARITGIVTATSFVGDGSLLTGVVATGSGVEIRDDNTLKGTATVIDFGQNIVTTPVFAGIVTVTSTSPWISSSNNVYTTSNVGIASTQPTTKLDIFGNIKVGKYITVGSGGSDAYVPSQNLYNIAVGKYALGSIDNSTTEVKSNIAIGDFNLYYLNSTGRSNTALGQSSLVNLGGNAGGGLYPYNPGDNNTAVGAVALNYLGYISDYGPGTYDNNTSLGTYSLADLKRGSNNIGIGWSVGTGFEIGYNNTIIGVRNVSSTLNSQILIGAGGTEYIRANSTGVGIGTTNPTSKITVIGDGRFVGVVTATAFYGTLVGSVNDATNLTGGYANASSLNVSGIATISQGRIQADSSSNIRFGNLPVGSGSAGRNIALGDQVLSSLNGGQGRNIGIGELVFNNTTSGQYNIGIGARAGQQVSTGSSNVIIGGYDGNSGNLDIRTSSNNVVIADGQGNIRQYINSSGNVGIKTTIITEALTVSGIVSATGFYGSLNAEQLTGTLPVIDGSNLFGVVATGSGVEIKDDGSIVGTAATINFGTNINVSFSSGIATVSGVSSVSEATTAYTLTGSPNLNIGIVTAISFSGPLTGNVTGNVSGSSATSGYATTAGISSSVSGTININTTGIITASSFSGSASSLTSIPAGQLTGNLPAIDGSALLNVNATGSGIVVLDNNSNIGSARTVNFGPGLDVTYSTSGIATITASGGSLQSRTTVSGATTSIVNNASANINITGFKSYALMRVGLSTAGWLRIYTDSTSRSNDASRSIGEDPLTGSGVIAEVITTGISTTQIISPFVMGGNLDNPADTTIYATITNLSGSTQSITANLTILQLEA